MATKNIYIPPDGDPKRLPHFTNVPYADELQEPIYKNLIEVNFFLPEALRAQGRNELLLMYNAKNISFQHLHQHQELLFNHTNLQVELMF